jgi:hypothetical protein
MNLEIKHIYTHLRHATWVTHGNTHKCYTHGSGSVICHWWGLTVSICHIPQIFLDWRSLPKSRIWYILWIFPFEFAIIWYLVILYISYDKPWQWIQVGLITHHDSPHRWWWFQWLPYACCCSISFASKFISLSDTDMSILQSPLWLCYWW